MIIDELDSYAERIEDMKKILDETQAMERKISRDFKRQIAVLFNKIFRGLNNKNVIVTGYEVVNILKLNKLDKFILRFERFCGLLDEFELMISPQITGQTSTFEKTIKSQKTEDYFYREVIFLETKIRGIQNAEIKDIEFVDGKIILIRKEDGKKISLDPMQISDFVVVQQHYDGILRCLKEYHKSITEAVGKINDFLEKMKGELAEWLIMELL